MILRARSFKWSWDPSILHEVDVVYTLYSWASRAFRTNAQNLFLLPNWTQLLMYPYGTVWGFTMTPGHAAANFMIVGGWNGGSRTNSPFHADSIKMTYRLRFCMLSPAREKLIFLFQLVGIGQYFQQNRCCERYTTNYGRLAALLHNTCTFQSILTFQSCCSFNLPWPLALIAGMSW